MEGGREGAACVMTTPAGIGLYDVIIFKDEGGMGCELAMYPGHEFVRG